MNQYKLDILNNALEQRENEIVEYEINISNYETLLNTISDDDVELATFKAQISELLKSSKIELRKTTLIKDAVQLQLDNLCTH